MDFFFPFASERHTGENTYATIMQLRCPTLPYKSGKLSCRSNQELYMKLFIEGVCGSEDLGATQGTIKVVYTTAMWCMPDAAHHATVRRKGAIRKAI